MVNAPLRKVCNSSGSAKAAEGFGSVIIRTYPVCTFIQMMAPLLGKYLFQWKNYAYIVLK